MKVCLVENCQGLNSIIQTLYQTKWQILQVCPDSFIIEAWSSLDKGESLVCQITKR